MVEEKAMIICLCGSTKFKKEYLKVQAEETLKGNIVLSNLVMIAKSETKEEEVCMPGRERSAE
jgi:hypothetical protein